MWKLAEQSDLDALRADLLARIGEVLAFMPTTNQRLDALESRMTAAESRLNSHDTALAAHTATLSSHTTTLASHGTTIADHEARLDALEAAIPPPPPPPPPPPAPITLTFTGDPVLGPYQITAQVAAGTVYERVAWSLDGNYWASSTVTPHQFFRGPDPIGSPIPFRLLGTGGHRISAAVVHNEVNIAIAILDFWEGAIPPVPPQSPIFRSGHIWNTPVTAAPLHAMSASWMDLLNGHTGHNLHIDFGTVYNGRDNGIPLNIVAGNAVPKVSVALTTYAAESDTVPPAGLPIPTTVRIEGDPGAFDPAGDNHCLLLDTDTHLLHEFFGMQRNGSTYIAKQYSRWDVTSFALRQDGWTSADAAGLSVAAGLVRYDEVARAVATNGVIPHALRFTLDLTHGPHLWPARHDANSGSTANPPLGMHVRLKASFDVSGYSPTTQAILRTLKTYGMMLADNGGDWFIQGVPDSRWNPTDLATLNAILPHDAFEVVDVSGWRVSADSGEAHP